MRRLERGCGPAPCPLTPAHADRPKCRLTVRMLDAIEAAQKRAPRREPFNLRGAAYRIRTYDALIRSQVLYPAEVTPRARTYIASHALIRQARIGKKFAGSKNLFSTLFYLRFSGRLMLGAILREWAKTKNPPAHTRWRAVQSGGELGIRTPDSLRGNTRLAGEHLRPLGQLSVYAN